MDVVWVFPELVHTPIYGNFDGETRKPLDSGVFQFQTPI